MSNMNPALHSGEIDAISLSQALRDVEIANARVVDLTRRLLESEQQRQALADQLLRHGLRAVPNPAVGDPARSLRAKVIRKLGVVTKTLLRVP